MYQLTLTDKQAKVIEAALDFYSRIGCGQYRELQNVAGKNDYADISDEAEVLIDQVHKMITGMPENCNHSIRSHEVDPDFQIAYDLQQVIRYCIAWEEEPAGSYFVRHNKPFPSSNIPLATMVKVNE